MIWPLFEFMFSFVPVICFLCTVEIFGQTDTRENTVFLSQSDYFPCLIRGSIRKRQQQYSRGCERIHILATVPNNKLPTRRFRPLNRATPPVPVDLSLK